MPAEWKTKKSVLRPCAGEVGPARIASWNQWCHTIGYSAGLEASIDATPRWNHHHRNLIQSRPVFLWIGGITMLVPINPPVNRATSPARRGLNQPKWTRIQHRSPKCTLSNQFFQSLIRSARPFVPKSWLLRHLPGGQYGYYSPSRWLPARWLLPTRSLC